MTIVERVRTWNRDLSRRADRRTEMVDAVYDSDLWSILDELGLLQRLDAGELRCAHTGVALSRDNVGALVGSPSGPKLISEQALLAESGQPTGW